MKRYIGIFVFIFLITECQSNVNKDLKPPHPTITADNQEISYAIGTYSWSENGEVVNADSASPAELVEKVKVNKVISGETMAWILKDLIPMNLDYQSKQANSFLSFMQVGMRVMEFMLSELKQLITNRPLFDRVIRV
ncbi:hypothetical protein [Psychrobacillus sp. NPDC096389]|uniref:hypothetical protein n=1 Tax=Psychrobacillus sp. NPDC096389 TaxID=3364490 RepID=UPI00382B71E0